MYRENLKNSKEKSVPTIPPLPYYIYREREREKERKREKQGQRECVYTT
jgi:hypothetical protein